jgi:cellulose biosynthesis protein BcsQ
LAEVVVLICCWSVKGGAGTTVVATALALILARRPSGALLVDVAGDGPTALGLVPEPMGPGVVEWLVGGPGVPADGLGRLEVDVCAGLRLLPRGHGGRANGAPDLGGVEPPESPRRPELLAALLTTDSRAVVADAGLIDAYSSFDGDVGATLALAATHSLLVLRPCFLALRRAVAAPLRPSGVVLVEEAGRSLRSADVEDALGVPVRARVGVTPSIARAVDAGLLSRRRLPSGLTTALRHVA